MGVTEARSDEEARPATRDGGGVGSGLDAALSRIGDRWSLLVVAALLEGPLRFKDLSRAVDGIAPNILTDRLRRLERAGVLVSAPYSSRPVRMEYRLTEEGQGLGSVLRMLAGWSAPTAVSDGLRHAACGTFVEARWFCPTCARTIEEGEGSDLVRL